MVRFVERYCEYFIKDDLSRKMVFIGGPRQVGKTTLSQHLCQSFSLHNQYFNWDIDEHRQLIRKKQWRDDMQVIIFDELHKYRRWKSWIKGVYDGRPGDQTYLLTGSARMDVYKRGGDSLLGRYHYWRLHPFTIDELPFGITPEEGLKRLLSVGGFPEPFLLGDEREARRWRKARFDRILREDIRDLENVQDLHMLSLFVDLLSARVGSTVVLSNIAQDLEIAPNTAKNWLQLAERMYLCFCVTPLTKGLPRAIKKPPKVYFFDNCDISESSPEPYGAKMENLVATTLLKRLHFIEDYEGRRCQLHYIRDKEKREVDFVTVVDGKIVDLIEVKKSDAGISTSLRYYHEKLRPDRTTQIVFELDSSYDDRGIRVTTPIDFFSSPPWAREDSG